MGDLRHASPGQVAGACGVGQVAQVASVDQLVDLMGQGQQASDARDTALERDSPVSWRPRREVDGEYGFGNRARHGATSAANSPNPAKRQWIVSFSVPPS